MDHRKSIRFGNGDGEALKMIKPDTNTSAHPKATMTLNLPQREMDALDALAREKSMSKTAIMRQALKIYQLVDHQMREQGVFNIWDWKPTNPLPPKVIL